MTTHPHHESRAPFVTTLILKGLFALPEIFGGIALLLAGTLMKFVTFLVDRELIEDPSDWLASTVQTYLPFLWHTHWFGAVYLLSHGVIKIVLVIALLYRKAWAYPTALVVLGLFIFYQMVRYSFTHSIFLLALSLFDALIMYLIWKEYERLSKPFPTTKAH